MPQSGLTNGLVVRGSPIRLPQLSSTNSTRLVPFAGTGDAGSWSPPMSVVALAHWYDPSDLTTLFKDTAGTVPVTTDGDLVACIKDKSGNNNHAIQATSGNRPVYRSAGYLEFSGAQNLVTASGIQITDGSGRHSTAVACYFNTNTGVQNPIDADPQSATRLSQLVRNNGGTSESIAFTAAVSTTTDTGPSITAATAVVLSEITSTTSVEVFVNGTGNGSSVTTPPMQAGQAPLNVGSSGAAGGGFNQFLTGRFYGSASYQGALSTSDHAQLVSYLAAKTTATTVTSVTPSSGHLLFTGYQPTISRTATLSPSTGHLAFTGYQPAITRTAALSPVTGHLTLGGKVPSVTATLALSPSAGHLTFSGKTPTIAVGTIVSPSTGHLTFTGHAPALTFTTVIIPTAGHLTFGGKVPSVTLTVNVTPSTGHLAFTGYAPSLTLGITPATGHLVFTGYAPDVSGASDIPPVLPLKVQYRHRNRNG